MPFNEGLAISTTLSIIILFESFAYLSGFYVFVAYGLRVTQEVNARLVAGKATPYLFMREIRMFTKSTVFVLLHLVFFGILIIVSFSL